MSNLGGYAAVVCAFGLMVCGVAGAQVSSAPATVAVVATAPAAAPDMTAARVFVLEDMPARKTATGGESRDSLKGMLVTGESVSVHESVLPVGAVPRPLHKIQHSEVVSVLEGTVEFQHDGKAERVGPGGVIYVAFGTVHAMKNVGSVPARYVVVAIGGDVKR